MSADPELIRQAREEADAILAEAREQAQRLTEAAEARRKSAQGETDEIRSAGRELATNLEKSIDLLTQILEELRKQLD
jgi:vacuolar-type H+-ATPase subunit H